MIREPLGKRGSWAIAATLRPATEQSAGTGNLSTFTWPCSKCIIDSTSGYSIAFAIVATARSMVLMMWLAPARR